MYDSEKLSSTVDNGGFSRKQAWPRVQEVISSEERQSNNNAPKIIFAINRWWKIADRLSVEEQNAMTSDALKKYKDEMRRKRAVREFITHAALLITVVLYSFAGAALFQALEADNEISIKIDLATARRELINNIWIENVNISKLDQGNWTLMVEKLLTYYEENVSFAMTHGIGVQDVEEQEAVNTSSKWDFWGSLFYAGTVFTTIGYGHIAPTTVPGKVATLIYATFGIPLCLILLADLGDLLSRLIKWLLKGCKRAVYTCRPFRRSRGVKTKAIHKLILFDRKKDLKEKWPHNDEIENLSGGTVFICLVVISLLYLFVGAAVYRIWETDWTYLDALYFIFISTSTIGFGDVLPAHPRYFLISSLYIFFGLSLISTGFTVLQEMMQSQINKATDQLDGRLGLEKTDKDNESNHSSHSIGTQVSQEQLTPTKSSQQTTDVPTKVVALEDGVTTVEATITLSDNEAS